ncbi:regulator RcnB of Ni and Co efflux [Pseudomonas guineae]|uniref:Regulator RcnB of Ni and Co efflux n=1 Tax=Pseudomonas guineae TaxID=425504 RepID=A0A1I3DF40_9PSED|nr:anti-virulence regulator CigR family protein [Pseudomonas guineae]SFH85400.1 regulator RcnB of Ni and Co efflux [Pseudomonas guineae]|tara:strand:- start:1909 stop:2325 length:417 start_codon:yes stop_codon:yes gene_type:complete
MRNFQKALLISSTLALTLAAQSSIAAPKHDNPGKQGGSQHSDISVDLNGPSIDIGRVRIVLGENRNLIGSTRTLPPGIAKNLARGKPLPPGIAKNFDSRLLGQLPHYDGYQWQQMGTDVVLVAIASGIIYEVLRNVLD